MCLEGLPLLRARGTRRLRVQITEAHADLDCELRRRFDRVRANAPDDSSAKQSVAMRGRSLLALNEELNQSNEDIRRVLLAVVARIRQLDDGLARPYSFEV